MKRKTIDAMHEVRLTIVQVVIPATLAAITIDKSYPNLKYKIKDKCENVTSEIRNKVKSFKKRKIEEN